MRLAQRWPLGRAGNHSFYLACTFPQQLHVDLASCAKQDAPLWCSSPVAAHVNRFFLHLQLVYRNTKKFWYMIGELDIACAEKKTRGNISYAYCSGLISPFRRITAFWRTIVTEVACTHHSAEYLTEYRTTDSTYRSSKFCTFSWETAWWNNLYYVGLLFTSCFWEWLDEVWNGLDIQNIGENQKYIVHTYTNVYIVHSSHYR
jgi:hypothetical protein